MTVVVRESKETHIRIVLTSGSGVANVATGEPFLDHMLTALTRYAGFDLDVKAKGDLRHHLIEDVAIALGAALQSYAPATCARYGERTIPMDDALVHTALDLGGRPYYRGPLRRHCTITSCVRSWTTRGPRCTFVCCAEKTGITLSKRHLNHSAWHCAKHSAKPAQYSAPRAPLQLEVGAE